MSSKKGLQCLHPERERLSVLLRHDADQSVARTGHHVRHLAHIHQPVQRRTDLPVQRVHGERGRLADEAAGRHDPVRPDDSDQLQIHARPLRADVLPARPHTRVQLRRLQHGHAAQRQHVLLLAAVGADVRGPVSGGQVRRPRLGRSQLFGKVSDRVQSRLHAAHHLIVRLSTLAALRQPHARRQLGPQLSPRQPVRLHQQQREELDSARLLLGLALLSAGGRGGQAHHRQLDRHHRRPLALVSRHELLELCRDRAARGQVRARLDRRQDDKSQEIQRPQQRGVRDASDESRVQID